MLSWCPHHLCSLPTEGLLTLRAKPPTEAEYTDVLQKIKYAFSLLVRTHPLPGVDGVRALGLWPIRHSCTDSKRPPFPPGPVAWQHRQPLLSGAVALSVWTSADGEPRSQPSGLPCFRRIVARFQEALVGTLLSIGPVDREHFRRPRVREGCATTAFDAGGCGAAPRQCHSS